MDRISFDMTGRTALVTGASSGIGRRLCEDLAVAGANVVAAARRIGHLESLVQEIESQGGKAVAVAMDVADRASVAAGFDVAEAAFGTVHSIYANAGIHLGGSALELPMEDFDRVMSTNVNGVILTAREGVARLIRAGGETAQRGRVVVVGSIRGLNPVVDNLAYCTSKAASIMAGKTMALEWAAHGINVNIVCPGVMITEISEKFYQTEAGQRRVASAPRQRVMEVDDLKYALLYLGSDHCRAVTGSVITIDDGQTL